MAKKFKAVNILVSARVATKEEFENENPILELNCFAINSEGYETTSVDNLAVVTSGVKLGDGVTKWADLPYLEDVTASLVSSWLEFEANASKARLVTLPDTNFIYDLSEDFQNMIENKFNANDEDHAEFRQRMDELNDYITTVNNTLNNRIDDEVNTLNARIDSEVETFNARIDNEVETLSNRITSEVERLDATNARMDAELDALRAADQSTNEDLAATKDILTGYMDSNDLSIQDIVERLEQVEKYAPVELVFSGGDSTDPIYTTANENKY